MNQDGLLSLVGYLYEQFILRDAFAKIVPGSIVLLSGYSLGVQKTPIDVVQQLPALSTGYFLLVIGLSWILGHHRYSPLGVLDDIKKPRTCGAFTQYLIILQLLLLLNKYHPPDTCKVTRFYHI